MEIFNEKNLAEEFYLDNIQRFLGRIKQYDAKIAPTMRSHGFYRIDSVERTVSFTFGEVTYSRSRWRKGSETRYPVDEWLGLKKHVRHSPQLIVRMAQYATFLSYRQVCQFVYDSCNVTITKDCVLKALKAAEKLLAERERYRFYIKEPTLQKIKVDKIYIEGDGVLVKTSQGGDDRRNMDLAHFLVHTGSKKIGKNRYSLKNKHEIICSNYVKAKDELLDYLYNHFEITDKTILITNSDNGKGYTGAVFREIQKALGIKRHEHFWDAYHVNEKVKQFFRNYPVKLQEMAFSSLQTHSRSLMKTVLDTVESLVETDEELEIFLNFKRKILQNFSDTKPAELRGLSPRGIGVMESQHRKITYRMKHRGMYWSRFGCNTMAKLILLERSEQLEDLFLGAWRQEYELYQNSTFSAGRSTRKIKNYPTVFAYKTGNKKGKW